MKASVPWSILALLLGAGPALGQESATSSLTVLSVGQVLKGWDEYQDIVTYVQYVRELDWRDLKRMEEKAIELGKEAERNFAAGDLSEEDYRVQKAAVTARLRKLRNYWEISEEIINSRLEQDREKRRQMMQDAVNDLGLSKGYDIILKDRSMAYYDPVFEVAPEITRAVNRMSEQEEAMPPLRGPSAPAPAGETTSATEP